MGGHSGGEVASKLAVESFVEAYINSQAIISESLRSSLDSANQRLADTVAEAPKLRGMATTLIGCAINESHLYWISVGDSPLWVFRSGILHRINADHSMVPVLDEMVREGTLEPEEALLDFRRNLLRSGVSGKAIELIDLSDEPYLLMAEDIIILASDGVETLSGDELVSVLGNPADAPLQVLASNLMTRIRAAGHSGQDNASVILYRN